MVRTRADRNDGIVARRRGNVDLVVANAEPRDQAQIGRRREDPLGIGLAACHRCERAGQRRDQLFLSQKPAARIHDQLNIRVAQALQVRRLAAMQLVDVDKDSAAGHHG